MIDAAEMKARGMCDCAGTCAFCGQMRTVWTQSRQEYSEDDLNKIATSECDCAGALKEEKKRQLYAFGKDAIRMTLEERHRKIAADIMLTALDALTAGRIKKVSVQMDKDTTATMYLARVEKDTRVIVECKTTTLEWSDGVQDE